MSSAGSGGGGAGGLTLTPNPTSNPNPASTRAERADLGNKKNVYMTQSWNPSIYLSKSI